MIERQQIADQDPGSWRDGLLVEIEKLTEQLKHKIHGYVTLRATQISDQSMVPDNEAALTWVQEALDDIAATARGIEIASHEMFLQAMTPLKQDLQSESARKHKVGSEE